MGAPPFNSYTALCNHQLVRLNSLFEEILPRNRFYAAKLKNLPQYLPFTSIEDFFSRVPFTTKSEWSEDQTASPPYGSLLTYPLERYTRCHQTSGSTGSPMRWLDTPESWEWMLDNWIQVFQAAGTTRQDRIFFAFSFGPFIGFWTSFEAALKIGCFCLAGGGMSSDTRLRALSLNQCSALCCTPTYAVRLAEVARAQQVEFPPLSLKTIFVAGEPGGSIPETRARLEALWPGIRFFDHHGMTEVGPVSYECPALSGVLHVIESSYVSEVIDPNTLDPVEPGHEGELVLTTLGRLGSPLIRYRSGDLVRPLQRKRCSCGTFNLGLQDGIIGRTDDMVFVRGVNVYPSSIEAVIRSFPVVVEYQVRISTNRGLTELTVLVELESDASRESTLASIEREFQKALALRIPVKAVAPQSLPRFEMKAKRWIRES